MVAYIEREAATCGTPWPSIARHMMGLWNGTPRPLHHWRDRLSAAPLTPDGVYRIVRAYSAELGLAIGAHALRATAASNALDHHADIAKVREWLGHANIATTRIYDRRKTQPEDSPTFKVAY